MSKTTKTQEATGDKKTFIVRYSFITSASIDIFALHTNK